MITLTREEAQQVLDALEAMSKDVSDVTLPERLAIETLSARLSALEPEQIEIETLKQCLFQMQEASKEQTKAFDRLVRIMGTFDLATGHADGWNDLLDSLESELRDVLGHYREALKARQEPEPVAWRFYYKNMWSYVDNISDLSRHKFEPLYTAPPQRNIEFLKLPRDCKILEDGTVLMPQREWQGLTDEDFDEHCKTLNPLWNTRISRTEAEAFFMAGAAKLRKKNS